jgi:hypothetical protein
MILAYGIVTVLAVIVGSIAGHTLTKYSAKRMDERQFNRAFLKALEEVAEDAIKDIERIKFYEKIKAEQEKGCWESYRIQKSPKGYIVVLICPHRAKAIDIPQSFTEEDLKDLRRHLFNCRYKKEQK